MTFCQLLAIHEHKHMSYIDTFILRQPLTYLRVCN